MTIHSKTVFCYEIICNKNFPLTLISKNKTMLKLLLTDIDLKSHRPALYLFLCYVCLLVHFSILRCVSDTPEIKAEALVSWLIFT